MRILFYLLLSAISLPSIGQYIGVAPFAPQQGGLIINEISNGTGVAEYFELVVLGDPNNPLAPVNLEGYIIDDNNIDESGEGTAGGYISFGNCYNAVPPGSIIVVYNAVDKNATIPADDENDDNGDNVYIIPSNSSCLVVCNSNPGGNTTSYCPCEDPAASGSIWQLGLRNSGDIFQVRDRCETVVHAISWSDNGNLQLTADVSSSPVHFQFSGDQSQNVIRFLNTTGNNWNNIANYTSSNIVGNETPSGANSRENLDFINAIRNGTFNYDGVVSSCQSADAGDLLPPNDAGFTLPIQLNSGDDIGAFTPTYNAANEIQPDAASGFTIAYAYLLTNNNAPDFSIVDFNLTGDFDFSGLADGSYIVWGLSFVTNDPTFNIASISTLASVTEIQNTILNECNVSVDLDNRTESGELVEIIIGDADCSLSLSKSDVQCPSDQTGSIQLTINGGSAPFTIDWNVDSLDGLESLTNLGLGTYIVNVSDGATCNITDSIEIIAERPEPDFTATWQDNICPNECATAEISFTGTPPFSLNYQARLGVFTLGLSGTVQQSDTSLIICPADFNISTGGLVEVEFYTLSDAFCTSQIDTTLTGNILEAPEITLTDNLCTGNSITVNGTVYDVNNPTGQEVFLNAAATGCDSIVNIDLTFINSTLTVDPIVTNADCASTAGGAIDLNVTGSTGNVTFDWSVDSLDGQQNVDNLTDGFYSVEVFDDSGCSVLLENIEIQNTGVLPTLDVAWQDSICQNECTNVLLEFTGTPPFRVEYEIQVFAFTFSDSYRVFSPDTLITVCPAEFGVGVNGGVFDATFISIQDATGCTSQLNETYTATVRPIARERITETLCPSESIIVEGTTFDIDNPRDTITIVGAGPDGCDSVIIVDLSFQTIDTTDLITTLCEGEILEVNGTVYDESNPAGVETIIGGNSIGCDSIVSVNLTYVPPVTTTIEQSLCIGESITINGNTYDENNPIGQEIITGGVANGCDSIINVNLTFPELDTVIFSAAICPGGAIDVNGTTYDENNLTGIEIIANGASSGCDSIIRIDLQVQAAPGINFTKTDISCPGDTDGTINLDLSTLTPPLDINWDNDTFDGQDSIINLTDGSYNVIITDALNCNVEETIDIIAANELPTFSVTFDTEVCQNDCGTMNAQYTGTPPFNLSYNLQLGLVNVDLDYTATNFDTTLLICPRDFGVAGGGTVTANFFEISDANCTNVINETFTGNILATPSLNLPIELCEGESFNLNGTVYDRTNLAGTEVLTGAAANGCDSIINVSLNYLQVDTFILAQTLCAGESLTIGSTIFDENNLSGLGIITGGAMNGCDSIVQVDLSLLDVSANTSTLLLELCEGQDTVINGTVYSSNNLIGTEVLTNAATNGCDSIVNVTVDVVAPPTRTIGRTLCEGETFEFNGTVYDQSNPIGVEMVSNPTGCDSLIEISLNFTPSVTASIIGTNNICFGDSAILTFEFDLPGMYDVRYLEGNVPQTLIGITNGHTITVRPNTSTNYTISEVTNATGGCYITGESANVAISTLEVDIDKQDVGCEGQTDGSITLSTDGGIEPIAIQWSTGETDTIRENLTAGTYDVMVMDGAGCTFQETITIEAGNAISVSATTTPPTCFGDEDGTITIDSLIGGSQPYTINIDGTERTITNGPITFRNLEFGTFQVGITDSRGCTISTAVEVPSPVDLILELGDDIEIGIGDTILLSGASNLKEDELTKITWTPIEDTLANNSLSQRVAPEENTTYFLVIEDGNGCSITDQITVFVSNERNVFVPNIFSPNNDGSNDFFTIYADNKVSAIPIIQIFDRWGNMVYESQKVQVNQESTGWDGRANGKQLNPGIYIYRAEIEFIDGKKDILVGTVSLIR